MCLPVRVLYHKFWYNDLGVFMTDVGTQFTLIRCTLSKLLLKASNLSKIVCFMKLIY